MAPVLGVTLTLMDFALSLYLAYQLRALQSLYPTEMHIGHFPWFESVEMCNCSYYISLLMAALSCAIDLSNILSYMFKGDYFD
jgi:hypothetical protein